ncbi:ribonuclease III [Candidatus Falkowbacteria bacterium]|uniref:Ribonuclease 3 n=1 Tax=Candidatus Falkowbacteria bacterium CG10_big_fil_rev_8_21_14_0_10_37_18 TaxID=1974562 RepID=A0A2H0V9N3_9BACT|nr:ribonuclease III [Candidatus Falkowbacteria bacterium]NCQ12920.1 ribonuclease III [Candidatus Falkowbacteria bacterium]OIO06642.1 MAG: ribonuclease III [Candidatus Falkowbacteria bacterium CG1_02_37_21]PIR95814.1 MAG: ribonuclease III [Candidatus Falkowbacteria bacterium CG10_big_fil_rev_8_21_14_0_10_37_18]
MTNNTFLKLQKNLGVTFKNEDLLRQALVHRSYLNEHPDFRIGHNERLEFLGDAVLEIIVTEFLYLNFTSTPEGDLTNWRASLVNAHLLYEVADQLDVEDSLYLSRGEARDKNKKSRQFILANAMEAIIGAIYLDQGMAVAKKFVLKNIVSRLDDILRDQSYLDPKSLFQEKSQEKKGLTPHYKILDEKGPDHAKLFTVGLYIGEEKIADGDGSSKQEAQVDAAAKGLKKMGW